MSKAADRIPYHLRPQVTRPSVLVLHEKHGKQYFYVPDEEALFKAALEVLKARNCAHYYYKPEHPKDPGITKEQVEALPEVMKAEGKKKLSTYDQEIRQYEDCLRMYETIQKTIEEGDGRAAWRILRDRNDGEYERVSLEPVLQPGDYKR